MGIFDFRLHEWRLYPVSTPTPNTYSGEDSMLEWVPDPNAANLGGVHLKIPHGDQKAVRLSEDPLKGLICEPCFVGRRWSTLAEADPHLRGSPAIEEAVTPDEASRARQRLVLAQFEVTHATNG